MKVVVGRLKSKWRAAQGVILATLCACAYGLCRAYRWAEPSPEAIHAAMNFPLAPTLPTTLENVSFECFANGYKNWSVHADRIQAQRAPGTALSGLQQAIITGIRSGELYASPRPKVGVQTTVALNETTPTGPPTATFTADGGRYAANAADALPPDLRLLYSVTWQFQLLGNVRFKTSQGERMTAPAVTVLEMHGYRSGRLERRILCDQGADIASGNVSIHANAIRFDPASRLVECLGGVRGTLQGKGRSDTVQADSAYWSLRDNTLRCPGTVTGRWGGTDFVSQDMMIDTHTHDFSDPMMHLRWTRRGPIKLALP